MWQRTALYWLGLLSTLLVCSAMDGQDESWREYRHFPAPSHADSSNIKPRPFGLPIPGHEPESWESMAVEPRFSASGSGSAISRPFPGTIPPSAGRSSHPNTKRQRLYEPADDPFTEVDNNGQVVRQVKQFFMDNHQRYGPFTIGLDKFENKRYPLDVPLLQNTWSFGSFIPTDFETFAYQADKSPFHGVFYRPHPEVLEYIRKTLDDSLRRYHWTPEVINPRDSESAKEAEFLWPPVHLHRNVENQLSMIYDVRHRFNQGVKEAIKRHPAGRSVWTMQLGHPGILSFRKILMVRVRSDWYTTVMTLSPRSEFWLFYEGLLDLQSGNIPRMNLLGGMFLPKGAVDYLMHDGIARPSVHTVTNIL
ncbi:uncharacterized protein SPSC_06089 [Sporisorium scitamineum]|uniref:Effector family protein Eff1 n=1 Tax=Sporisorium scitamineum TaxID=49012 RepID=A0A0F7S8W6_9BASI|nr:uncharacterized protein SPSC_06089 [Sporisorium scitamineum]CDW97088.1 hypothetical protein [Sporisorium scitamineum]